MLKVSPSTHYVSRMAVLAVCCCLVLFSLISCGGSPDPKQDEPQWTYAPGFIKLRYRADPMLNMYDETGHALLLCIYQLSDPNSFNSLAKTQQGLRKLLECKEFDGTVASYQRLFVQPKEDQTMSLDRAEKATFMGIAAGYNQLDPKQSTKLYQYPVTEKKEGFFTTTTIRKPGKVFINLFLGPTGIQQVGGD
ncbi:type VI secretion lipoprotein TssJ [Desulfovibrio inopinatus]|uniref:type VI secretion lipoprotein TssJ n=1 Tax=Desulfovibrio inopinatus TaxID=102109 RepID=UPI000686B36D|nr:type VI secretion lipoprotein TssJ [Desulfovibrio inopinatus]